MNEHIITTEGICCCNCGGDYTRMDGITVGILHKTISFKCTVCGQINHKGAPIAASGLTTPAQAVVIGKAIAKLEIPAWPDWADAKPIASGTITADKINFAQVTGSITADKINPAQVTTIMNPQFKEERVEIFLGTLMTTRQQYTGIEKKLSHHAVFQMAQRDSENFGKSFLKVLDKIAAEFEEDLRHICYMNNDAAILILTELYKNSPFTESEHNKIGRYLLSAITGSAVTFHVRGVQLATYPPSKQRNYSSPIPEVTFEWDTRPKQEYVVTFRNGRKKTFPNMGKAMEAVHNQVGWTVEHKCD